MMVKNRHLGGGPIREIEFCPPVGVPDGIEVLTLAELGARTGRGLLTTPLRPAFHHLIGVSRGGLRHTVDFTEYPLRPGGWLWVRPGQVHQWGQLTGVEGTLILFQPDFPDPETAAAARLDDPYAAVVHEAAGEDGQQLADAAGHLARTFADPGRLPLVLRQAVLRHLLAVVLLRLAHVGSSPDGRAPEPDGTFARFRDAVERDFTRSRRIEDYARALGYASRTLSRATLANAGVNAKEFIDRRTVLEARRLLAHGEQTAAQIAARLGFTSATNFSKYFHHRTGTTPIAFRAAVRGQPPKLDSDPFAFPGHDR